MRKSLIVFAIAAILFSCKLMPKKEEKENVKLMTQKSLYGMIGADSVFQYTLTNKNAMVVKIPRPVAKWLTFLPKFLATANNA